MKEQELAQVTTSADIDAECRTLDLGIQGFAECLRQGPSRCRYALPFGYAFLCSHPRLCRGTEASEVRASSRPARGGSDRRN
jgi:hypothetical protein